MLISWLKKGFNGLLASTCVLCGARGQQDMAICLPCKVALPWLGTGCNRCALPLLSLPEISSGQLCAACLIMPPPYTKTIALCRYEQPVDRLIMGLKFNQKLVYARLLGELMAEHLLQNGYQVAEDRPECLIPVPLHPQRLRERGFNQVIELARPIANKLRLPIDRQSCQRVRSTEAQSALPAVQRQHNVKGAFAIVEGFNAKHVAVLDDVMTTGHTMAELCQELQKAGVERIDVWCCARTELM